MKNRSGLEESDPDLFCTYMSKHSLVEAQENDENLGQNRRYFEQGAFPTRMVKCSPLDDDVGTSPMGRPAEIRPLLRKVGFESGLHL